MEFSMDFKPRFILGNKEVGEFDFNFYDYDRHKDIKCYDVDGETVVPEEYVTHVLNKYYSKADHNLSYTVNYIDDPKNTSKLNKMYICTAYDCGGFIRFKGYSEFSAPHAMEDCEIARKLILQSYWKS